MELRKMIARLWAEKIVSGSRMYSEVPRLLKEQVRKILIEGGHESLLIEKGDEK